MCRVFYFTSRPIFDGFTRNPFISIDLETRSLQTAQSKEHRYPGGYPMPKAHRCTYPKSDGTLCRSFAAGRSRLCHWHSRQAARDRRRARALHRGCTVRIGPLDTSHAIQNALNRVLQPLAAGTLPLDRASRYLHRIQFAVSALHGFHRNENRVPEGVLHLANLPEPRTVNLGPGLEADLEPGLAHLLSLIQPPTIEQTPPFGALNPRSTTIRIPTQSVFIDAPEREQHTQDDHHATAGSPHLR
jgi:hypothetical protein